MIPVRPAAGAVVRFLLSKTTVPPFVYQCSWESFATAKLTFSRDGFSSLRAQRSNPGRRKTALDCFAALAMTNVVKSPAL
jgi:hypothetical protein